MTGEQLFLLFIGPPLALLGGLMIWAVGEWSDRRDRARGRDTAG